MPRQEVRTGGVRGVDGSTVPEASRGGATRSGGDTRRGLSEGIGRCAGQPDCTAVADEEAGKGCTAMD